MQRCGTRARPHGPRPVSYTHLAILLFDEADALFGKRSQVRDSHDRYANLEISYLLQRMESYRGIAILTTNMQGSLDTAFQRRLRFVVQFPFPDAPSRAVSYTHLALDPRFAAACAAAQPDAPSASASWPAFGLAVAVLDEPHWSAMSRLRPLRYWRLLEVGPGPLLHTPLEIDERILQFLLDVPTADERLELLMHPLPIEEAHGEDLSAGLRQTAQRGAFHWRQPRSARGPLLLTGARGSDRIALFHALCREAGVRAWEMEAAHLPESPAERERLARVFTREAVLWPVALLVRTTQLDNVQALASWLDRVDAPIAVEVEPG